MIRCHGYAARRQGEALLPLAFERRSPGPEDLLVEIRYCGICHTDLNAVHNVRGRYSFPLVPGHEMVGTLLKAGQAVAGFRVGDWVGIGPVIDSCRSCASCKAGLEPYCSAGMTPAYGFPDRHGDMAYGGFSSHYVIDQAYAVRLPDGLDPAAAAPLLCAGITTYSPLRRAGIGPGAKVGIVGLGGLGHVAIKWARALGAHVTLFTSKASKAADSRRLGADEAVMSGDCEAMSARAESFDFILDCGSGAHDLDPYLALLKLGGQLCLVGIPADSPRVSPVLLASRRRSVSGSMTGGISETREMLDFAARHGIACEVELIGPDGIETAFSRLEAGDVRYRFVVDMEKPAAPGAAR